MVNIFQFLQDTKSKRIPFLFKLINNLLTEDDLIYNGDLDLFKSNITSLPDNLIINGDLKLSWSKIISLPNNLTVKGNLTLTGCTDISYLPNNLIIYDWLDINGTNISDLPDDLYVGGNLYCYNTPLKKRIKKDNSLLEKYKKQIKGNIFY